MRHTFSAYVLLVGVSPGEVAQLTGHSSKKMVYEVYGHFVEELQAEKQQIEAEVRSLIDNAVAAESAGRLEDAERGLEDALALDPENVEALGKLGEVRDAIRAKLEEEETRRRADEQRRKHEAEIRERLREAAEDREAGRRREQRLLPPVAWLLGLGDQALLNERAHEGADGRP